MTIDTQLKDLALAYKDAPDPDSDFPALPAFWTPAHVGLRMVAAFDHVCRNAGRVGPASFGNAWPAMLTEFHELVDPQSRAQMERDKKEEAERQGDRATANEISMANEALEWPMHYLNDEPLKADALNLWAFCVARDLKVSKILQQRRMKAEVIAAKQQIQTNADLKKKRRTVAIQVAEWANQRMQKAASDKWDGIKNQARNRYAERIAELHLAAVVIRPRDAMPAKILGRSTLDWARHEATGQIAEQLNRRRVMVR